MLLALHITCQKSSPGPPERKKNKFLAEKAERAENTSARSQKRARNYRLPIKKNSKINVPPLALCGGHGPLATAGGRPRGKSLHRNDAPERSARLEGRIGPP